MWAMPAACRRGSAPRPPRRARSRPGATRARASGAGDRERDPRSPRVASGGTSWRGRYPEGSRKGNHGPSAPERSVQVGDLAEPNRLLALGRLDDQLAEVPDRRGAARDGHTRRRHRTDEPPDRVDRKSTRLNSSHITISYAVFCLKKKT